LKIIDFLAVEDDFGTIGPVVPYFTEFFNGDFHVQHKKTHQNRPLSIQTVTDEAPKAHLPQ